MMWEKAPDDVIGCVFNFVFHKKKKKTQKNTKSLLLYKRLKMDAINNDLDRFAFQGATRPVTNLVTRAWVFRGNDVIQISKSVMKSNQNKKKKTTLL